MMKDYEIIGCCRRDLTKYVIHFTKEILLGMTAIERLQKILREGFIKPTFAPRPNRSSRILKPTIKGPYPAVCLAEIPLWALIEMRKAELFALERYSGYGIAYHSGELYCHGGRPAIYGDKSLLGTRVQDGHPLYQENRHIYEGGIPLDQQYLWTRFSPENPAVPEHPIDFRWEREWRMKTNVIGLPIVLPTGAIRGAIIVEDDEDVPVIRQCLSRLPLLTPAKLLTNRIISLETAERGMLKNPDYGRIETWPDFQVGKAD